MLGPDGTALVARMVHAAGGRLTALHYGTYDYSAFCGIAAEQQSLEHPVADHAKLVMQAAAAGTGVRLSDGSTNVLPVGDADDVHAAWLNHHRLVTRSLEHGFYQGWDLHPGQLPTRYAATYAFFRTGLPRALDPTQATTPRRRPRVMSGGIADEPATARALADFVLRGLDCGAVDADEVREGCGLGDAELRRSPTADCRLSRGVHATSHALQRVGRRANTALHGPCDRCASRREAGGWCPPLRRLISEPYAVQASPVRAARKSIDNRPTIPSAAKNLADARASRATCAAYDGAAGIEQPR